MIIQPIQFIFVNNSHAIGVYRWIITLIAAPIRSDAVVAIIMDILRASDLTNYGRGVLFGNRLVFAPTDHLLHPITTISLPHLAALAYRTY
jgi:hypothetical protein